MTFIAASFPQAFCTALPLRPVSTTAANSAIRCRCGMTFIAASFLQAFCTALSFRPVPTTAANSAIRCRCGMAFIAASFPQAFCAALSFRPVSTTAENPAIQCRCGIAFRLAPATGSLIIHLILLPPSSTFRRCAEFPCFRLTFRRCAEASLLRERPVSVFFLPPCISHLPKVRGVATSSRAPCVRVSPAAVHFPPSEGAQISLVFVSPSEGVQFQNEKAGCALS